MTVCCGSFLFSTSSLACRELATCSFSGSCRFFAKCDEQGFMVRTIQADPAFCFGSSSFTRGITMACAKASGFCQTALRLSRNSLVTVPRRFQKRETKRFYKAVSITQNEGQFELNLDRRKLKTPMGNLFRVPNEPLALAVAAEWGSQKEFVRQTAMYLTNLCNSAIDNPVRQTKDDITEHVLKYLDTDTLCFRMEDPPELFELQNRSWGAVVDWVEKRHGIEIGATSNIVGPAIPESTKETLRKYLRSHNQWSLIGIQHAVESLKSVLLTLAMVDRHLSVETAVALSRLEEEFQIAHWGNVEWAHDLELMHLKASVAASLLFIYLNTEMASISQKAPLSAGEKA